MYTCMCMELSLLAAKHLFHTHTVYVNKKSSYSTVITQ